jgi:tubulin beta
MALMLRGNFDGLGVDEQFRAMKGIGGRYWREWCGGGVMVGYCKVPPVGCKRSATCVTNGHGVGRMLQGLEEKFCTMWRRQAFVHVFTEQGMDKMEFDEAVSNVRDL